jgi:hypothetical protein
MKDQLYLLEPGFLNADAGPFYCGDSVCVEGFLSFFPQVRDLVDVQYLAFNRPRSVLVSLLGEEYQSLPVIVLADERQVQVPKLAFGRANGKRFLADEKTIREYLSSQYSLPTAS